MDSTTKGASTEGLPGGASIAGLLKARMQELGITSVSALAAKIDKSVGSVSAVLKGHKIPSANSIHQYAAFLGMRTEDLTSMAVGLRRSRHESRHAKEPLLESGRDFIIAVLIESLRKGLTIAGLDNDAVQEFSASIAEHPSLDDARLAYESEIAARTLEGLSPSFLTNVRRLSKRAKDEVEQLADELANGKRITATSKGKSIGAKRSERYKDRRERRSRRLSNQGSVTPPEPPPADTR